MLVSPPTSTEIDEIKFRPNHVRAQLAVILLGVCALVSIMTIAFSLTAITLFQRLESGDFTLDEIATLDERLRTLALFDVAAYLLTAVAFLFWIHRAYQNHDELSRQGAMYATAWSVLGFIIPLMNLFRPYQVVGEMWGEMQVSDAESPFPTAPMRAVAGWWWASFLAMNIITNIWSRLIAVADTPAGLTSLSILDIIIQAITILSAILAIRIVQTLDTYHETRVRQILPTNTLTEQPGWGLNVYAWSLGLGVIVLGAVLFGSSVVVNTIDQIIASVPTTAPARQAASSPVGSSKPVATPTKYVSAVLKPSEYEKRGNEYLDAGDYEQALNEFSQALKGDPNNARLRYLRGIAYGWLEDYDNALVDLNRAIQLNPKYMEAYYERGMAHLNLGNYGLADKDFEQALKFDAKYTDAFIGRSWMHYVLDEYADALKDANQAIQLDKRAVDAYHVRGLIYLDTGKFDQAITDFSEAIKLEPESAWAFNRRGLAYHSQGELDRALQDYEQALKLEPEYIDAYYNRGVVNYDRSAYQAALSDFTKVIKEYPEFGRGYLQRGATYAQLRDYDKAIADVEKALALELSAADRTEAEQMLEEFKAARQGQSS